MSPYEQVKTVLLSDSRSPLHLLVGDRIYEGVLPERSPYNPRQTMPAIVLINVVVTEPGQNHVSRGGIDKCSWQIDCWAENYADVHELARLVKLRMLTEDRSLKPNLQMQQDGQSVASGVRPEEMNDLHRVLLLMDTWHQQEA